MDTIYVYMQYKRPISCMSQLRRHPRNTLTHSKLNQHPHSPSNSFTDNRAPTLCPRGADRMLCVGSELVKLCSEVDGVSSVFDDRDEIY